MSLLTGTVPVCPGLSVIIGAPVTTTLACCAATTAKFKATAANTSAAVMLILAVFIPGPFDFDAGLDRQQKR